jgi:formylglycine-generating enzyme required for sulfatase activity
MHKIILRCVLICVFLLLLTGTTAAQPPTSAPPKTFWDEHGKTIVGALVGLIFGGVLTWLLKPTFERLGNRLADRLGRLGSGWGFKKRYLTHLIEEYRGLNIRGLKTRAPVTVELEQVYVSLHAQVPDTALGRQAPPPLGIGEAMMAHERLAILGGPGTGKTTLLAYLTLTCARGRVKERLGLTDGILSLSKEKWLPILVPLRQLKQVLGGDGGSSTLPDYLTQWYTELGIRPREDFFEKALRDGRCLVLLDGLDEVADEAERRAMSEWVDRLVTIYPYNRYIVTSRPPGYESAPLENGFTVLRIRDFTVQEIRQFATNWCLAVELAAQGEDNPTARRRAGEAARDLVAAIEANADIRKLAVNPLLLSIIALVHRYRATLPKRRVDLYAECVDVLLGHWDAAKGLAGRLSPGEKRAVLGPLALQMHKEQRRDIPRPELEARVARLLPTVGGQAGDAEDFLDEVRERSGLLIEVGVGAFAFSHQTFQEYLCAREIVDLGARASAGPGVRAPTPDLAQLRDALDTRFDEGELRDLCFDLRVDYGDLPGRDKGDKARELVAHLERRGRLTALVNRVRELRPGALEIALPTRPENPLDLLLAHVGDEWWQEVTLLYAGMADATPIVQALLSGDADAQASRLLLAGRCVAEAVRLDEAVRQQVLGRLEGAFATCTGERFLGTGQVLADIAGEDSVDFFLRLARDDPDRREAALWSLGQMGRQPNEALRERVIERLLTCFQSEELRQEAGAALKEMWGVRVVAELHQRRVSSPVLEQAMSLTMVRVPAGEFLYSDKKRKISLPEFWIDKTPVTNAQYAQFVSATDHEPPKHWRSGAYPEEKATHPVVNVSWRDAVAYAEWVGKRLPTEEEWEKAARGTDGREYPWGDEFDKDKCNTSESGIGSTTPVGQYSPELHPELVEGGDSPYGCADMAGNVWEWCEDWYDNERKYKVLRGGSWLVRRVGARSASRIFGRPVGGDDLVGFRCCLSSTSSL